MQQGICSVNRTIEAAAIRAAGTCIGIWLWDPSYK